MACPKVILEIDGNDDDIVNYKGLFTIKIIVRNNCSTLARESVRAPIKSKSLFRKAVV